MDGASSKQTWTDEEWAEWRRQRQQEQQQAQPPRPPQQETPTSLLPLPPSWKVVLPPAAPNQAHKSSDFSEMQRTANRQLRKMYTQWQNEVEQLKAQNNMVATSAIFNQASGNASLIGERNKAEEKQKELDALREEMEMKHRREIKEVRRGNREKLKKFREEHFLYKTKCKHSFKKFRARADSAEAGLKKARLEMQLFKDIPED